MEEEQLPILIRKCLPEDQNYIYSSWLKSFRHSFLKKMLYDSIYFYEQHRCIEELLKRCEVTIACSEEEPSQVFGYLISETKHPIGWVIHYIFTKETYRDLGIARKLILEARPKEKELKIFYTHSTREGEMLVRKLNAIFNPYWGR